MIPHAIDFLPPAPKVSKPNGAHSARLSDPAADSDVTPTEFSMALAQLSEQPNASAPRTQPERTVTEKDHSAKNQGLRAHAEQDRANTAKNQRLITTDWTVQPSVPSNWTRFTMKGASTLHQDQLNSRLPGQNRELSFAPTDGPKTDHQRVPMPADSLAPRFSVQLAAPKSDASPQRSEAHKKISRQIGQTKTIAPKKQMVLDSKVQQSLHPKGQTRAQSAAYLPHTTTIESASPQHTIKVATNGAMTAINSEHAEGFASVLSASALQPAGTGIPTLTAGHLMSAEASTPGMVSHLDLPIQHPHWPKHLGQSLMRIATHDATGQTSAQIRLDPPHLGPLQVSLHIQEGQINAQFFSPHAFVRQSVEQALPQLFEQFNQAGLELGNTFVGEEKHPSNEDLFGEQETQRSATGSLSHEDTQTNHDSHNLQSRQHYSHPQSIINTFA